MSYIPTILVALVALEHVYILILEMYLWDKPRTRKVFGIAQKDVETLKVMAGNQGLYNGFLAAGIFWGLFHSNPDFGQQIQIFFLSCVVIAAIYGGYTVKKTIWLIQGLPALLGLVTVLYI